VRFSVSAANSYDDACNYSPASAPEAMTVGATDAADVEADFSNRGPCVDIWAPGVYVRSAAGWDDTASIELSGTSMAAPHVTGTAALYLELNPQAAPADIVDELKSNATTGAITWSDSYGEKPPPPGADQDYLLYSGFIGAVPVSPPAAPSDLVAKAPASVRVELAWTDNATDETRYELERCQGSSCGTFTRIALLEPNSAAFTDRDVQPSTSYTYRLRASNREARSQYSDVVSIATPAALTASGLIATAISPYEIDLSWSDPGVSATDIEIDRCTATGCTGFATIASLPRTNLTFNNQGLGSSTTYRYRIRVRNQDEVSPYSSIVSMMTMNVAPVAHFSWTCNATKGGRVCKFDGSTSRDDVRVTNWSWSFGDGRIGTGSSLSNTFAAARSYTVRLTVRDTGGTTASVSCKVQTGTKGSC
jgi:hypothetical protein